VREPGPCNSRLLLGATYLCKVRERQLRAEALASRGPWVALIL
jgi:hypothetical protein